MTSPFQPKTVQVPGLLSDDAFQEQLKQFAKDKNAQQNAAPPPNSAVEFSEKIKREYLKGGTAPGPVKNERLQAQDEAIDVRSDILSNIVPDAADGVGAIILRRLILGPLEPMMEGGALDAFKFSEEQQQEAADEQLEQAKKDQAATRAAVDAREKLRGEVQDNALDLGFSGDLLGAEDVPGLNAQEQERNVDAAKTLATKEKAAAGEGPQPEMPWWLNAAREGYKSFVGAGLSTAKWGTVGWELTVGRVLNGGDIERSDMHAWIQTVEQTLDKLMPGDKARSQDFVTQLSQGGGSMAAFMVGGFVGQTIGLPARSVPAIMGAMSGGSEAYEDAERFNAVGLQKYLAFIAGTGLGLTEAIPIDRMFLNAEKATGGLVSRMLTNTTAGSLTEFIQEFGQAVGQDVIARAIYDENRAMDVGKWLKAGAVGAITGGVSGASVQILQEAGVLKQPPTGEPVDDVQREQAAQTVIDVLQGRVDALTAEAPPDITLSAEELADSVLRGEAVFEGYVKVDDSGVAVQPEVTTETLQPEPGDETLADIAPPTEQVVTGPGGSIPVNERGMLQLDHWSDKQLSEIDPAQRGTGPLRGEERKRIGDRASSDPDVVDRSYYGAGTPPSAEDRLMLQRALRQADRLPTREGARYPRYEAQDAAYRRYQRQKGYVREGGLGDVRHTVEVRPDTMYNVLEDPLNLRSTLDPDLTSPQRATRLEKLIKDAGFKGVYYAEGTLGQTAILFDKATPTQVVDQRDGLNRVYEVADPKTVELDARETAPLPGLTTGQPVRSVVQAARAYAAARGLPVRRQAEYVKVDPERAKRIADAYEMMKHQPNNPKVKAAYKAMADETLAQYQFVKATGLEIEAIEPGMPDPYPEGPKQVLEDLQRGHLWFYPTDQGFGSSDADISGNPLLVPTDEWIAGRQLVVNDVFRIVHDFFGHGIEGSGFGPRGEENAWQSHMRLYSPAALPAVTSETRGQNSWVNFGPYGEQNRANQRETVYADQKTGIMPSWTWTEGVADDTDNTLAMLAPTPATPADFERPSQRAFSSPGWAIVTATQEAAGDATAEANMKANEALRGELKSKGVEFIEVGGSYQGVDQGTSFMVFGDEKQAMEIAQRYGQESILTRNGLEYTDGRLVPVDASKTVIGEDAKKLDFFSTLPNGETFSIGLDFDRMTDQTFAKVADPLDPAKQRELTNVVPGLKNVWPYMTPEEQARVRKTNAQKLVDMVQQLPSAEEMAAVAFSGRAKRGWYERSAKALLDIFGIEDAPRFSALLAALSPQTSVEQNTINALNVWTAWIRAGRPLDEAAALRAFNAGLATYGKPLGAWVKNSLAALTATDVNAIELSGPKVSSFMSNLNNVTHEVTNDAWMTNYAGVTDKFVKGQWTGDKNIKSIGYMAMSTVVRRAADTITKLTGETWTPAEIQETVWSWAKTLYEKSEGGSAEQFLAAGRLTAEDISNTPDFATLFVTGVYRNILEQGGYDLSAVGSDQRNDGRADRGGDPTSAEGSGLAQSTFDANLRRAARRLDALRTARQSEARIARTAEEAEVVEQSLPSWVTDEDIDALASVAPTQIKSVNNSGRFNPNDPNILASTSSTRGSYKAEQKRPDAGIATPQGQKASPETADLNLTKITRNLTKLMDLTLRQGRISMTARDSFGNKQDVMGEYNRRQDVARVRSMSDLSTVVHEAGHALYFGAADPLKTFVAANDTKLMKAAKDLYGGDTNVMPKATQIAEGFAEFFRVYTLNRSYALNNYPDLTQQFDDMLTKHDKKLKDGLEAVGQQFAAWLQLPSSQMVANMIVSGKQDGAVNAAIKELQDVGFNTWFHEKARKVVAESVNRYAGLDSLVNQTLNIGERNAGKAIDLKRADDPRALIRLAQNSGARAHIQLSDGVMGYRSTTSETRSLRDAFLLSQGKKTTDNLSKIDSVRQKDFAAFLVALRGLDEYRRLGEGKIKRPPVGALIGDLKKTVDEMTAKYPEFAEAATIVHEYGMGLWKKTYDAGLMSKETYEDGLDRQFYAPLQRDMSDKKSTFGDGPLTSGQNIVKRLKGSDRNIIDPMDILMHKTFALEEIIARNEVAKTLAGLADRAGKAGALVERIPASQLIGTSISVKDAAIQLTKDENMTEADAADLMLLLEASIKDDKTLAVFRAQPISTLGDNVILFWENGKLAAIQLADGDIGADVVNVVNGLGREVLPLFVPTIAATSSVFRNFITMWPDFLVVNFIRDQMSAFILTRGFKPFWSGLKGVGDEVRQKQWAKQYNAAMGMMGGMNVSALHDARVSRDINALRKKGYIATVFRENGLVGALQGVARLTNISETGSRLGIFRASYDRAKADGLSDWEASIEASYTATDYMNFGLNGTRMLAARRTIPFLNAQLQGLYKMMRTLGGDEVRQRKGLRFALSAFFKSTHNMDLSRTEKMAIQTGRAAWIKMASLGFISAALHFLFEDDPDYQEAGEYLRTTGWVIPMGEGRLAYIPKPFELAMVANFVERAFEHASGDKEAKARFMRGFFMNIVPPTSPPAIQSVVEYTANRDFFTGQEIIPSYMQALSPELQFNNYTTAFAKQVGEITGWSPMVVDHFMSSMGASAYRDITNVWNAMDPARPAMDATDAPLTRRFVRDVRRGSASSKDFWAQASTLNGTLRSAEVSYKRYLDAGNDVAANAFLDTLDEDTRAYALLTTHFEAEYKRLNPFYRARQLNTVVSAMRRELVTDLGIDDTTIKNSGETIQLSRREKNEIDTALSELSRREMRNTLIRMGAPGWFGKRPLRTDTTLDLIEAIDPRVREELDRRIKKAKVYSADAVYEYWPEVKDRLLSDRENTFLKDILTVVKVSQ